MEIKLTRWSSETGVQQAVSAKLGVTGALLSLTDPSDQGAVVLLGDLLASVKEDGEPCAGEIDTQHRKVVTVQCKAAGGTSSAAGHTQPQGAAAVVAAPKQAVKGDRIQKPEASTRGQNQDKQLSTPDTESMHVVAGLLLQRSRTAPYAFLPIDSQPVWAWTLAVAVVEGLSRRASKAKGVGEKAPKKYVRGQIGDLAKLKLSTGTDSEQAEAGRGSKLLPAVKKQSEAWEEAFGIQNIEDILNETNLPSASTPVPSASTPVPSASAPVPSATPSSPVASRRRPAQAPTASRPPRQPRKQPQAPAPAAAAEPSAMPMGPPEEGPRRKKQKQMGRGRGRGRGQGRGRAPGSERIPAEAGHEGSEEGSSGSEEPQETEQQKKKRAKRQDAQAKLLEKAAKKFSKLK